MKKRLLLLFLCALLSFSLIACEKEEISVIGEFYTEDGLVKNSVEIVSIFSLTNGVIFPSLL